MDDTEIRLHCVEVAEGDLLRAKQIYSWVMNRDEPVSGGIVGGGDPVRTKGLSGLGYGIAIGSGTATTRA